MQEPLKSKRSKKTVIAALLILVATTGWTVYILVHPVSSAPPLDNGNFMVSFGALTKINEITSAGFSVWNDGGTPLTMEKVDVCFTDNQIELVEAIFIKIPPQQGPSALRGTPEQNAYVTYAVVGYTVEPKHEAQLYLSLRALAAGYHSATKIIFTYTYLGLRYRFTYNIQYFFTLEVENSQ